MLKSKEISPKTLLVCPVAMNPLKSMGNTAVAHGTLRHGRNQSTPDFCRGYVYPFQDEKLIRDKCARLFGRIEPIA
jgi:hypothetical protein